MNVQRLIEKYKGLEGVWDAEGAELARQIFLQDLEQLDEPKPVKVPPFVAVWYEINKENLDKNIAYLCLNNWGEMTMLYLTGCRIQITLSKFSLTCIGSATRSRKRSGIQ